VIDAYCRGPGAKSVTGIKFDLSFKDPKAVCKMACEGAGETVYVIVAPVDPDPCPR
jgi:hypothetical protein